MSVKTKVQLIDNLPRFVKRNAVMMDSAMARLARDVKQISMIRVPFKDGDLQDSAEVEKLGNARYRIKYTAPYAGYQHRGQRKDGSRKVRHYTTPGTGTNYLLDAAIQVKRNHKQYLLQAARLVKAT